MDSQIIFHHRVWNIIYDYILDGIVPNMEVVEAITDWAICEMEPAQAAWWRDFIVPLLKEED